MTPLHLSPLPVLRSDDGSGLLKMEREGFVDELAVTALMLSPARTSRQIPHPADLALAADDLDFAGWNISPSQPPRLAEAQTQLATPSRRPTPPVIEELGLGIPHSGGHRWWLAGLAGVLSTMLFSLLLLNLSTRSGTSFEVFFTPHTPMVSQPVLEKNHDNKALTPELTTVSSRHP